MTAGLSVVVQAVPGRAVFSEQMRPELEASDIGTNYELMLHPEGQPARDFFLSVLRRLAEADTEYVLRLEDDLVRINRHVRHNLLHWRALGDSRFGLGWGFAPGGISQSRIDYIYQRWQHLWVTGRQHGSLMVLLRRDDVNQIHDECAAWFETNPGKLNQDLALSAAVAKLGKQICVHAPSLCEHSCSVPSVLGNSHLKWDSSCGSFRANWRCIA